MVTNASVSDDRPSPGGSATLSVTVRNVGARAAAATTLRFYQSADQTITTADTEIGKHAIAELAPSGTGDGSVSLTAPLTAPSTAGTYYYGACVDTVTGESDTANNCSSSVEITVVEPGPNLVVSSPSVSDSGPAAGTTFTLSAAVRNDGDESSAATTLRYYRSTDAIIMTSDTEVGTDTVVELAASESGSLSVDLTAPALAGTYYYGACVDAVEGEANTRDNCSSSVQIRVPEADLVVESPAVSNSAPAAGTTFTLSATVRNDGAKASAVTTMRFYRSTDATITTSDTEVGTDTVEGLAPSGTRSRAATSSSQSGRLASTEDSGTYYYLGELELDAPSTPGTFFYGACVDSVPDESDTTNNCSSSAQITVRSSERQVPGTPDLNPYTIAVEAGLDGLSPGGSFSLSVRVRNDGNGSSAATTLRYYRSTDATVTTSDTEVGTDDVPSLAPAATSTQSVSLTAPSAPGAYYYRACVDAVTDESPTTNNCSSSVQVTVSEPKPDLVVASSSVTNSTPSAGSTFTLWATIRNDGDKASAAATLNFYRSMDATITSSDVSVGMATVGALAASGGTIREWLSLTAPSTADTYYYGACVASVTGESDTTNNCSASVTVTVDGAPPDLVVLGPGVGSDSRDPGEMFRLLVTVHNQGAGGSAATTVKFYRSTDATITVADTLEGTEAVNALAPSSAAGETILLTAPSTAGTYNYGACVDAVPRESDTTNNCSTSVQVTVPRPEAGPAPDLVVGAPSVTNNELDTGETFTLSATVTNDGDEASAATTLRYYRSTDEVISTSDAQEDTDAVAELAASGTSSESVSLTAPLTAGIYYYGACVDSVTGESDTTNNCSESVPVDVTE